MTPEQVVAKVFGVDHSRVTDETSNKTLEEWDSLGHMTLMIELEAVYLQAFSAEEVLRMTTVAAIKRILTERGVTWSRRAG